MKYLTHLTACVATTIALSVFLASFMPSARTETRQRRVQTQNGTYGSVGVQGENGAAGCVGGRYYGHGATSKCGVIYNGKNGSYSGTTQNQYNAGTGEGTRSINRNGTYNGKSYGHSRQTNY